MAADKRTFHLSKTSQLTEDRLAEFLTSHVDTDITTVPGVGKVAKERLAAEGVETTHQLLGAFLRFKGEDTSIQENCDMFYGFIKDCGISSHVGPITLAVAEKVNTLIPGTFDAAEVQD